MEENSEEFGHRSRKREKNKNTQEFVIKQGLFKSVITPDKNNFINCLQKRAIEVSKGVQRLSFAVNLFIREQLEKRLPDIPENLIKETQLRQLVLGLEKCSKIEPWVRDFLIRNEKHLPERPKRYPGDTNSFTQMAALYAINYKNYLHVNFKKVQEKFVNIWGELHHIPIKERSILRLLINNWNTLENLPEWTRDLKVLKMIEFHQKILNTVGKPYYPENEFSSLVAYFGFLSKYFKKKKDKFLTVAPISQIKAHFLKIDSDVLKGIFTELGYIEKKCSNSNFREFIKEHYCSVLDIEKNLTKEQKSLKYVFTGTVETDGTSLCIHFRRNSKPKEQNLNTLNVKSLKELCKKKGVVATEEKIKHIVKRIEKNKIKKSELKTSKKFLLEEVFKKVDSKSKEDLLEEYKIDFLNYTSKSELLQLLGNTKDSYDKENYRVIGNDPGRVNLFYGAEKLQDNTYKYYKLSKKQLYHESGIFKANKKSEKWNKKIQKIIELLSFTDKKDISKKEFLKYTNCILENYDTLWSHFLQKKWSRQRLRLYSGKQKCYSKFFNSLKDSSEKKLVVAYGDAGFASTCKNEVAAPTTKIKTECMKRFKTVLIDEFRTSKIHSKTDTLLLKVKTEDKKEVRGLLWCDSTIGSKFVNRDKNAAENMERIFESESRPLIMTRQGDKFPDNSPVKIIPNSRTNRTSLELQQWSSDDSKLCHLENNFLEYLRVFQNILV
jgi:hypothetical protein